VDIHVALPSGFHGETIGFGPGMCLYYWGRNTRLGQSSQLAAAGRWRLAGWRELRQRSELGSGGPELGAGAFVDGGARERAALGLRAGQEREERNARSGVVHGGHHRVSFAFGHI
jgi:hypothetical protein